MVGGVVNNHIENGLLLWPRFLAHPVSVDVQANGRTGLLLVRLK